MTDPRDTPPNHGHESDLPRKRPAEEQGGRDGACRDYRRFGTSAAKPPNAIVASREKKAIRRSRLRVVALPALAAVVVALVAFEYSPPLRTTLPAMVYGVWRTDASSYADRRFELGAHHIVFQTGEAVFAVTRYRITRVRESSTPAGVLFRVEYLGFEDGDTGPPLLFEFLYRPLTPSEIHFANQRGIVWRRVPTPAQAARAAKAEDEPDRSVPSPKRP